MTPGSTASTEAQPTHPWAHAAADPDRLAVVMADGGGQWTYRQLVEHSNRYANLLLARGLGVGDTIALLLENRPEYLALCWAAKNIGLHYVGVGTQLAAAEAAYIVANSDSRLLIGSLAHLPTMVAIAGELSGRCAGMLLDGEAPGLENFSAAAAGCGPGVPRVRRRGASMLYSSGTTGRPKGVRSTLADVDPEVPPPRYAGLLATFGYGPDTVFMNPGPLYHVGPQRFAMTVQRAGGTVVLMRRFEAALTLSAMDRLRVTHGLFVPTMFTRLLRLDAGLRQAADLAALRAVLHSAAPCPIDIKEQMLAWWGPVIHELYGGTEGSGATVISPAEWLTHKGSVGRPMPGSEVHIVGADGEELPAHTPGRVFLHSARRFEYYKDAEKTAASRHARGWSTLGDIGYVDADGYLYLTDREADTIISGGVNIYPREAENVLQAHAAVADVAVIGVPNAEFGEEVKAIVQLDGATPSAALARELMEFCRVRLSHVKCPRSIDFVDTLPRHENGKLYKRLLKDRYWQGHATRII